MAEEPPSALNCFCRTVLRECLITHCHTGTLSQTNKLHDLQGERSSFDEGVEVTEEPSFSNNMRPPAVRLGTAANDFAPESEEEVRCRS